MEPEVQRTGEESTKHVRYEAQKATDSLQWYDAATAAIRSDTEHICTTLFIRLLRFLPFVTRRWQPHTDSIPVCFIFPQTHIHTWKLEWSNYVNTSAHSAAGQGRQIGFFDAKFGKFGFFERQLA